MFPWGRNCLFLDMNENGKVGDRRFFARSGELLFLMLSFAKNRENLSELIRQKLLDSNHVFDAICKAISSTGKDDYEVIPGVQGSSCELPIDFFKQSRKRIDILCDDLIAAFSLPIPIPDIVLHASRLISLNLFCYYLEQSKFVLDGCLSGKDSVVDSIVILCESLKKENTGVRYASRELFKIHSQMSFQAIRAYCKMNYCRLGMSEEGDDLTKEEGLLEKKLQDILDSHKKHWGSNLHRFLAKDCGLASTLCTRAYRYAPSDSLIETLTAVLIPKKRLLFQCFLDSLFTRYHIVFGEVEFANIKIKSRRLCPDNDDLKANRMRLQNRLQSLGRLETLSDGFEFVLNTYHSMYENEQKK